ncbi:unnamed protein product [Dovyalis caffra]|uniref:Uncharacterized protein n=1 Tax=Dovyalis caffra TaxID=77055 RepID=A0AAV1QQL7_9ROSI|nr:unnamed protein product [Dovyalis caffra]
MVVGTFFVVVSLIGLIGTICKVTFLLGIYSFFAFLWILGLISFTFFLLLVTNNGASEKLSRIRFREYRFGDYSHWLREQFANGRNWNNIQSCMVYTHACSNPHTYHDLKAKDFYKKKLSPIESGCCKPPIYCGFESKNATFWVMPESGPEVPDSDCTTWSNEQDKLCYNCKSCRVGVLASIRLVWRNFAKLMCLQIVLMTMIYCISGFTRKNIQMDNSIYSRV